MSESETTVEELIELARGDQTALGTLLERYRGYLLLEGQQRIGAKLAVQCTPSDAVQETFARAVRSFGQFGGVTEAQFTSWLRRIYENYVTDVIRKGVRRAGIAEFGNAMVPPDGSASFIWTEPATDQTTPSQHYIKGEKALRLAQVLEVLPPDQRDAIRFRHLQGWSLKQISQYMGVSESAVAGLLFRGLKNLRESMSESAWL